MLNFADKINNFKAYKKWFCFITTVQGGILIQLKVLNN